MVLGSRALAHTMGHDNAGSDNSVDWRDTGGVCAGALDHGAGVMEQECMALGGRALAQGREALLCWIRSALICWVAAARERLQCRCGHHAACAGSDLTAPAHSAWCM